MRVQTLQQFQDEDRATAEGSDDTAVGVRCGVKQPELREDFLGGPAGEQEEAPELGHGAAAARLGNVGDNRDGGADELIAPGIGAGSPEGAGEVSAVLGDAFAHPGDEEPAGICAKDHEQRCRAACAGISSFARAGGAD